MGTSVCRKQLGLISVTHFLPHISYEIVPYLAENGKKSIKQNKQKNSRQEGLLRNRIRWILVIGTRMVRTAISSGMGGGIFSSR